MRPTDTVHLQTVMLLRQNEIVMLLHQIGIDTRHQLQTATIEVVVVVVVAAAIGTAIPETIMIRGEENMIQVAITVRETAIQHLATATPVVEQWIRMLTDQEAC